MATISKKIKQFNVGRNPELLKQKYQAMRSNAFAFYRGSCHLFYQDLPTKSFLNLSPASWICGDLHLENFGSYKADNREIYFDINDFDEAALAPCLVDIARLLSSIILAADALKIEAKTALQLCKNFTKVYAQTLQQGSARAIAEKSASGVIKEFFEHSQSQKRKAFINSRTVNTDRKLKLLINDKHVCKISKTKKQQITKTIETWAKNQAQPEFYQVLDVGFRIAGTSSLGLERYVLLINGKGDGKHYLLDMKIANPSCALPYLHLKQPTWKNEAERIIKVQSRMQVFPQALLNKIEFNKHWFVLKELQPSQDKLDLAVYKGKKDQLSALIDSLAAVVAWDQLRSGGQQGSAPAAEFIKFASLSAEWGVELLRYSKDYAAQVHKNYKEYCKAYDAGYFDD